MLRSEGSEGFPEWFVGCASICSQKKGLGLFLFGLVYEC